MKTKFRKFYLIHLRNLFVMVFQKRYFRRSVKWTIHRQCVDECSRWESQHTIVVSVEWTPRVYCALTVSRSPHTDITSTRWAQAMPEGVVIVVTLKPGRKNRTATFTSLVLRSDMRQAVFFPQTWRRGHG
uniref:Uncharacterized protein n=1 Tax=Cacopsylla melanoneura TaxID=428564 RepID=A0A8D9AGV4_9HEMI